jgi:hypothetical protein
MIQQIKDAIAASPELQAMAAVGNTQGIADVLSIGRKKTVAVEVGNGTILEVLGFAKGNAVLDVINSTPDFRYVKPLVEQGRLRLDSPLTIAALQSMVPAVLTNEDVSRFVARTQVDDPITHTQVGEALKQQ